MYIVQDNSCSFEIEYWGDNLHEMFYGGDHSF